MGSTAGFSLAADSGDSDAGVSDAGASSATLASLPAFKSGILAVKALAKSAMFTFIPCKVDKVIF